MYYLHSIHSSVTSSLHFLMEAGQAAHRSTWNVIRDSDHPLHRASEITYAFFNFYGPFNQLTAPFHPVLLGAEALKNSYVHLTLLIKNWRQAGHINKPSMAKDALYLTCSVATLVASVVHYRFAMILVTSQSCAESLKEGATKAWQKEYHEAGLAFYDTLTYGARLAVLTYYPYTLNWQIAVAALQIIKEMGITYKEVKRGRYLDAAAYLSLAVIRSYALQPQLKTLYRRLTFHSRPWPPIPKPPPHRPNTPNRFLPEPRIPAWPRRNLPTEIRYSSIPMPDRFLPKPLLPVEKRPKLTIE